MLNRKGKSESKLLALSTLGALLLLALSVCSL